MLPIRVIDLFSEAPELPIWRPRAKRVEIIKHGGDRTPDSVPGFDVPHLDVDWAVLAAMDSDKGTSGNHGYLVVNWNPLTDGVPVNN